MKQTIDFWLNKLEITDWEVTTEKINPNQVFYNGETYFIGIERDFNTKKAIIYHDIDLYEVAICHELLHIKYPQESLPDLTYEEYEAWIDKKSVELVNLEKQL